MDLSSLAFERFQSYYIKIEIVVTAKRIDPDQSIWMHRLASGSILASQNPS